MSNSQGSEKTPCHYFIQDVDQPYVRGIKSQGFNVIDTINT